MSTAQEPLGMYLHLARASQQRRRPLVRDKMLVLAGAVAAERGLDQVAACCRQRVLAHNAGHLIGQYPTFFAALEDERFQTYLRKLHRDFPLEKTEHILSSLGIELAGERQTYYTDLEYAASLLGVTPEELDRSFGNGAAEDRLQAHDGLPAHDRVRQSVETTPRSDIIDRPRLNRSDVWWFIAGAISGIIAMLVWLASRSR